VLDLEVVALGREAICENCLARDVAKIALKKQQRESEEEDAEAAIAEHEEDRSGLVL